MFRMVREFNNTFGIPLESTPTLINKGRADLRFDLMAEENAEYAEASDEDNLIEVFDALIDQMYILIGTIQSHGMEDVFMEGFKEVHRSNMSKLGEDGKPIYREDGKVIKGPNYFKPDLNKILKKNG